MTSTTAGSPFRDTNLAFVHQEMLTSIVRLRSGRQQATDAGNFRANIREALRTAGAEARNAGYSDQAIHDSQFALVTFLDDTIAELRVPIFEGWVRKPLLEELFEVPTGGEIFFKNLERLMGQTDSPHLADTLEVYLLCLLLGYTGAANAPMRDDLAGLVERVMTRWRGMRGTVAELSPCWRPPVETRTPRTGSSGKRRLAIAGAAGILALLLIFAAYQIGLSTSIGGLRSLAAASGGAQ